MRPFLERIVQSPIQSLGWLDRQLDDGIPFEWHHHPQFELTLTLNSEGYRYVGDHIGPYRDGDLVLVGPNTPHTWHSNTKDNDDTPHHAIVVWFTEAWLRALIELCPEWRSLEVLLLRARGALAFSAQTSERIRTDMMALPGAADAERLLMFIAILQELVKDNTAASLCEQFLQQAAEPRLEKVIQELNTNFVSPPSASGMASLANLSVSSFQRLFQKHTRMTPSQYIARLRIGQACSMLSSSHTPIAVIADRVGYKSLAQFNKTFRELKNMTPREFRKTFS